MGSMIDATIPVDPEVADTLRDARNRAAVGRLVSHVLHPHPGDDPLIAAIAALKAEVHTTGLTGEEIDAELAACNAEHRG